MNNYGFGAGLNNTLTFGSPIVGSRFGSDPSTFNSSSLASGKDNGSWNNDDYLNSMIQKANNGDEGAQQWLADHWANLEKEKYWNEWDLNKENTYLDRMMAAARRNGVAPYALSGLLPGSSQASFHSTTGSQLTQAASNRNTVAASRQNNEATVAGNIFKSILAIAGVIIAAII